MKSRLSGLVTLAVTGFALIGCLPTQGEKPRPCDPGVSDRCSTVTRPTVVVGQAVPRTVTRPTAAVGQAVPRTVNRPAGTGAPTSPY